MTTIYENECKAADLDTKEVKRIAAGISRYAKQAQKLGLEVFGGSGTGTLRINDNLAQCQLIVADLDGKFDGGDGATNEDESGLLRGEM